MGLIDQVESDRTLPVAAPVRSPRVHPGRPALRVNWLFSGVLLGAAGWLLVLGVIFAAIGHWIVAGGLLCGALLCLVAVWFAGRRSRNVSERAVSAIA
jgi:hypothetical protein